MRIQLTGYGMAAFNTEYGRERSMKRLTWRPSRAHQKRKAGA
jgi:hypothetical protein